MSAVRQVVAILAGAFAVLCLAPEGAARTFLDGRAAGRELADLSSVPAVPLLPGEPARIALPEAFRFRGALYDTLETGPEPGTLRLTWSGGGEPSPGGLLLQPLGAGMRVVPSSLLQLRRSDRLLAARVSGLVDQHGEPGGFDLLLEPGEGHLPGQIVLQWLQVPASVRLRETSVVIADLSQGARIEPLTEGLALRPGAVIVLPGDLPWNGEARPATGCDIAVNWCDVVRANDPGCFQGGGTGYSTCAETQAKRWHFREGQYCRSCPYTFYVTVECGTSIHLPFRDMEGNQIRVTNVFTGVQMQMEALNDCARTPFQYCDYCATGAGGIQPDLTGLTCPTTPKRDCIPYLQRSTLIQWGWPLFDRNGDTVADELPCGPPNTSTCTGAGSGAYAGHEEQNTDVIVHGDPALCGVFRIDILSGGFDWFLSANCTGIVPDDPLEIAQNFNIYQNCADALAAFDPVPELAITKLEFTGVCPDIVLLVEVTNLGCVDATTSPVHLDFESPSQPDEDFDLGVIGAGTSAQISIPVSLRNTPQNVTATVDLLNFLSECTEQPQGSFSGCAPTSGADAILTNLCTCINTVVPSLADDSLVACNGVAVAVDASASSALPCAGGALEYRVLDAAGGVTRDWLPDPVVWLTPGRCPSIDSYTLQVRCSLEGADDCIRSVPFTVECAAAPALDVTPSATEICEGEAVTLTASAGFGSYLWEDGQAGRVISDRPATTTTYRVTGTTPAGCVAQGEVTVNVRPDTMPGPVDASLRVRRTGIDLEFSFAELPPPVGSYLLVLHLAEGTQAPCGAREPATKPAPIAMNAAPVLDTSLPGDPAPQLRHPGGVNECPRLLFYKVVATSPCLFRRGTACNGFPMQFLPCP